MGLAIDGDGEPIIGRWPLRRRRSSDGEFKFDLTPKATGRAKQSAPAWGWKNVLRGAKKEPRACPQLQDSQASDCVIHGGSA
jgi:hypothetical protein